MFTMFTAAKNRFFGSESIPAPQSTPIRQPTPRSPQSKAPGDSRPTDFTRQEDIMAKAGEPNSAPGIATAMTSLYLQFQKGDLPNKDFMRGEPSSILKEARKEGDRLKEMARKGDEKFVEFSALGREKEYQVALLPTKEFLTAPYSQHPLRTVEHAMIALPHLPKYADFSPEVVAFGKDRSNPGQCYSFYAHQKNGAEQTGECSQVLQEMTQAISADRYIDQQSLATTASTP